MVDALGVFTPEQAQLLWQDYLTRKQLQPHVQKNFPHRREVSEVSPHRVFIKNTESEAIPAYGCVQVSGVEEVGGRTAVTVTQPTSTEGSYLFNSQYEIPVAGDNETGVGWAYRYGVVVALGDTPSTPGELFQPIVGSWEIEAGGSLFEAWGRHNADERGLIGRIGGGSGGGGTFALGHAVAGSVDCPNGVLEIDTTSATWMPSTCGVAPGADSYGIITVEDRLGWFSTKWTGRAAAPYPNQTDIEDAVYLRVSYGFENADGYGCDGIWWLDFPVIPPECPTGS